MHGRKAIRSPGADDFLSKPVDSIELLARLKAAERVIALEDRLARRVYVVSRS